MQIRKREVMEFPDRGLPRSIIKLKKREETEVRGFSCNILK